MWLKELKIAIIEEDAQKIIDLMDNPPHFQEKKEIDSALSLIKEATSLMESLKAKTQKTMIQMKKNIDFLKSTQAPTKRGSFDISS